MGDSEKSASANGDLQGRPRFGQSPKRGLTLGATRLRRVPGTSEKPCKHPFAHADFSEFPIINTGLKDYASIYELQLQEHAEVIAAPSEEVIILTEHHPVYTIGRRFKSSLEDCASESVSVRHAQAADTDRGLPKPVEHGNRLTDAIVQKSLNNIPIVQIERGGGLTYHGPGQIVGYPIIHLEKRKMSIPTYLRLLEKTLQEVLKEELNLATTTRPEFLAGVWVGDQKLVSIGIAVRHWVTFHGFALNVDCDLGPFRTVQPCGLRGDQITSLKELGFTVNREILRKKIGQKLLYTFFQ